MEAERGWQILQGYELFRRVESRSAGLQETTLLTDKPLVLQLLVLCNAGLESRQIHLTESSWFFLKICSLTLQEKVLLENSKSPRLVQVRGTQDCSRESPRASRLGDTAGCSLYNREVSLLPRAPSPRADRPDHSPWPARQSSRRSR